MMATEKNILCIEPANHNQVLLKLVINHIENCTSDCFSNGEDALHYLQSHPVALLITELSLPTMSGLDVIREVRGNANTKDLPIIVITSDDDQAKIHSAESLRCDYMLKPYEILPLLNLIKTRLGQ